jgi:uncharacterized SAM-binding protein YcdF (DUF218 family)
MVLLMVAAMPLTGRSLLVALETGLPVTPPASFRPGAIVVLGGDERPLAGADHRAIAGGMTLERLRDAARVARRTGLPLLVSGGTVTPDTPPEAVVMADSLREDFGLSVRWVEPASLDTWQNARFSAALLRPAGITQVLVVTHAWHMRRAMLAFAGSGLDALPAPVPLDRAPSLSVGTLLPSVAGWQDTYDAMHEWIGLAYYSLRGS